MFLDQALKPTKFIEDMLNDCKPKPLLASSQSTLPKLLLSPNKPPLPIKKEINPKMILQLFTRGQFSPCLQN